MAEETENKLKGRTRKKVTIWRIYLLIGFVALVVVASMGYIFYLGNHMTVVHTPLICASMEIKIEATTAHLWFEETISGDRSHSIDDVLEHIDLADWYAQAMLEGGQSAEGKFFPLSDQHMRQDITEIRRKLAEFREITLQRWQTSKTSGIGTEIDQKYDKVFEDFIQQAGLVETDLQQMIGKEINSFQIVQIVLIALCLAITVVVGITFSRFLKNQIRHKLELQAANLQLDAGNQQLMASEQQLKASNQQLIASEQQLRAANQQLTASEQQLKATNQQLTASEQEARILAKFPSENPNPVLRISKDNAILYCNQAAEPILAAWGCEENQCLCLPDRENKLMKIALNSGKPAAFDLDHSNRTFSITLAPVLASDYVNVYAHDITVRKQSEDAMRKSEEKYRQFYEDAPLGYQSLNASGNFLDVNREWLNVLGYSKEEVIGRFFGDFVDHESLDTFTQNFPRFKAGGKTRATEFQMIKKDGTRVTVSFDGNIEYDKDGHFKRTHCILQDITDRKRTEEQLFEYHEKLKSLASQMSVIEERERHRLATDLHDHIGQSLVMSKMKLDSLRESISSGESTDVLGEVCDCLGDVIRDTRSLTFDLSSPILYELGFETAVSEWLDEQIREKHGIETEFRDDGQPKLLDNDIRALLFRNARELLINIVEHAKARKVKVSVSKADEQVCVIIEDDGVGFEPAKIGSNTGFGIFSIRERLEQLDGHLEIESEPGRGSRFTMTAPLKVEKSAEGVEV
jgi:PAS domain S-box-containing protein